MSKEIMNKDLAIEHVIIAVFVLILCTALMYALIAGFEHQAIQLEQSLNNYTSEINNGRFRK